MTLVVGIYNNFKWEADAFKFCELEYKDVESFEIIDDMLYIKCNDGYVFKIYDSIAEVISVLH